MNAELIQRLKDPKFYLENLCKIKTKSQGLQPFILKEAQKDLFNALRDFFRIIILKSRQIGFSTAVTGWIYHRTITTPGITSALIGYNSDLTMELLDKVKTFHRTTPEEFRPTIKYNSKYEITFPKMDSKILVLPSTETVGRGYTLQNCLCTEMSFWEKPEEKMAAIEAAVPLDGRIIIESSPNFIGNLYHRMWVSDNTNYLKKKYGWWWNYTREEIEQIRNNMNDPLRFAREYECEFMSSGRPVFDPSLIRTHRKNVLKVGDKVPGSDDVVIEEDGIRYYRRPEPDKLYVIAADSCGGVTDGDNAVAVVFNRMTGEEVAFLKCKLAPELFGTKIDKLGRYYNNALMTPEVQNHGLVVLSTLRQLCYPNFYFRPQKFEVPGMPYSDKLGWRTTGLTRPLMIDDFAQALRDKILTIHSKEILDEMTTFVYDDNGRADHLSSFHDDCLVAAMIGYQAFKVLHPGKLEQLDYEEHLPKKTAY